MLMHSMGTAMLNGEPAAADDPGRQSITGNIFRYNGAPIQLNPSSRNTQLALIPKGKKAGILRLG